MNSYEDVKLAARPMIPAIVHRLLPEGRIEGREYVALNPTRADKKPGSFRINLNTGLWSDFATGDKGDVIGLVAYLRGISQKQALEVVAQMIGRPL